MSSISLLSFSSSSKQGSSSLLSPAGSKNSSGVFSPLAEQPEAPKPARKGLAKNFHGSLFILTGSLLKTTTSGTISPPDYSSEEESNWQNNKNGRAGGRKSELNTSSFSNRSSVSSVGSHTSFPRQWFGRPPSAPPGRQSPSDSLVDISNIIDPNVSGVSNPSFSTASFNTIRMTPNTSDMDAPPVKRLSSLSRLSSRLRGFGSYEGKKNTTPLQNNQRGESENGKPLSFRQNKGTAATASPVPRPSSLLMANTNGGRISPTGVDGLLKNEPAAVHAAAAAFSQDPTIKLKSIPIQRFFSEYGTAGTSSAYAVNCYHDSIAEEDKSYPRGSWDQSSLAKVEDKGTVDLLMTRIGSSDSAFVVVGVARAAESWTDDKATGFLPCPYVAGNSSPPIATSRTNLRSEIIDEPEFTSPVLPPRGGFGADDIFDYTRAFYGEKRPKIALDRYLGRLVRYLDAFCEDAPGLCSMGIMSLIGGVVLVDRVAKRRNFCLNQMNMHRVLMVATLVAFKSLDDEPCSNDYYAKVCGVELNELNRLEVTLLKSLGFDANLQPVLMKQALKTFFHDIKACEEAFFLSRSGPIR